TSPAIPGRTVKEDPPSTHIPVSPRRLSTRLFIVRSLSRRKRPSVAALFEKRGSSNLAGDAQMARSAPLSGGHSVVDPPDSIPNSAVKRNCADGSVALAHARVGHRQDSTATPRSPTAAGVFCLRLPPAGTSKTPLAL